MIFSKRTKRLRIAVRHLHRSHLHKPTNHTAACNAQSTQVCDYKMLILVAVVAKKR